MIFLRTATPDFDSGAHPNGRSSRNNAPRLDRENRAVMGLVMGELALRVSAGVSGAMASSFGVSES